MAKEKLRSVNTHFWDDPYIVGLDPSEKLLFLYLLTNPLCNLLGVYEISIRRISFDTGFEKDMVEKMLDRFVRDKKIICYEGYIALLNFVKNQRYNSNMLIGAREIFKTLPNGLQTLLNGYQTIWKEEVEEEEEREVEREKEIKLEEIKEWEELFDFWFNYKKTKGQTYKNSVSKEALKTKLKKLSVDNLETGKLIVEQSIANNWAGLFGLKNQSPPRRNTVQEFEPIKTY